MTTFRHLDIVVLSIGAPTHSFGHSPPQPLRLFEL
jgi:hypothetical protein